MVWGLVDVLQAEGFHERRAKAGFSEAIISRPFLVSKASCLEGTSFKGIKGEDSAGILVFMNNDFNVFFFGGGG